MKLPLLLAVMLLPLAATAQNGTLQNSTFLNRTTTPPSTPLPTAIKTLSVDHSSLNDTNTQNKIKDLLELVRVQYMPDDNGELVHPPTQRGQYIDGLIKTVVSPTEVIIENMDIVLMAPSKRKLKAGDRVQYSCAPDIGDGVPGVDGLIHYTEVPPYPVPTPLQVIAYLKSGKELKVKKIENTPKPVEYTYTLTW